MPDTLGLLVNLLLIALCVSAAVTDLKWNKIFNLQTYPAIICGIPLHSLMAGWDGALFSFSGFLVGSALLFVFFLMGGVGAGDVKLLGAIGALKGITFVLWTMFYTGLIGGAMAISLIIWKGAAGHTLKNMFRFLRHPLTIQDEERKKENLYIPYGVAISAGCLWALCTV